MNHKQPPAIESRKTVASSKLFEIESLDLVFSNGVNATYERMVSTSNGAVLIVPIKDGCFILIREYAVGVERYELGFPKGKIDPGENWEQAAIRESQEEIGYQPSKVTRLDRVSLASGYMTHQTDLVIAEGLVPNWQEGDEPEPLDIVEWPINEWARLLEEPDFSEGRAYAAVLKTLQYLGKI